MATILENFKYEEIELIKVSNDILKGYGVLVKENYKDYTSGFAIIRREVLEDIKIESN